MSATAQNSDPKDAKLRADIDRSLRHPVMFFFTSGALWLLVTVLLGFAASFKSHSPDFLGDAAWATTGRLSLAHENVFIYGWACQAAFGAIIWLMSRLCRKECRNGILILLAGHVWNFAVTFGLIGILGGASSGVTWMAFPTFLWPVFFVAYLCITIWSVIQFQVREAGHVYVSQWYLLAALIAFPWIFLSSHLFVFVFDGHPLMKAAVSEWYRSGLVFLFFAPVGIASAYYLAPKVTGRPVHSYHLAMFGFWSLMVIAPWAGFQKLAGAPIPRFLPYVGAAATVLFLIPALAVAVNILRTILDDESGAASHSPSLRFTIGGMVGMLILGFLGLVLNMSGILAATQFSLTGYGLDILALYGFFSMCAFGLIYFVVPRVTRREWLSKRFITSHFYLSLYGVAAVVLFSVIGGWFQGGAQNDADAPWADAATFGRAYAVGTTMAWLFISLANIIFLSHLLLMWARLGRRSTHPTLLDHGHHTVSPHGPEGDIEEIQAAKA
ncbi:cbb3-type cytochrome c oxidase subunit I [Roseibacillus ishigakijimensis]|uniref:Cbb3-type cytochrome c oxidase subunit I n=1 Tax=Roseibacillus ishigakijimensis TaxID=454146 RepID=A0A934RP14_9BACT|nr:cbb3-type cytochrome c oxidase subunit I [Roseibacillus ishigakijimensis]MBK1834899.1 cbb3-type cytochrome c oxidase subunit I [Roseibacillus ishigakijimensis]